MATIEDYRKKIELTVQDKDGIVTKEERDTFILEAAKKYSKIITYEIVTDFTGDGSSYDFTLPPTYYDGFSVIRSIEFPQGDQIPTYLEDGDWQIYKSTTLTPKLRLLNDIPSATQTLRVIHTSFHLLTSSSATINAQGQDAVCNLASALYCYSLARHYARTAETTITADTVNYQTKSDVYAARARELIEQFNQAMNIDSSTGGLAVKAASIITEWDTEYQWQQDYLLHPKRNR